MIFWGQLNLHEIISTYIQLINHFHDYIMRILIFTLIFITYCILFRLFKPHFNKYILDSHVLASFLTLLPIIIFLFMAFPSLELLYIIRDGTILISDTASTKQCDKCGSTLGNSESSSARGGGPSGDDDKPPKGHIIKKKVKSSSSYTTKSLDIISSSYIDEVLKIIESYGIEWAKKPSQSVRIVLDKESVTTKTHIIKCSSLNALETSAQAKFFADVKNHSFHEMVLKSNNSISSSSTSLRLSGSGRYLDFKPIEVKEWDVWSQGPNFRPMTDFTKIEPNPLYEQFIGPLNENEAKEEALSEYYRHLYGCKAPKQWFYRVPGKSPELPSDWEGSRLANLYWGMGKSRYSWTALHKIIWHEPFAGQKEHFLEPNTIWGNYWLKK